MPNDPAILNQADINSSLDKKQEQFPIMSISKSFCGALCSLMAAKGELGSQGLNSSLFDILHKARGDFPARQGDIDHYLDMLQAKNLGQASMADILSHRAGIGDLLVSPEANDYQSKLAFFADKISPVGEGQIGEEQKGFQYSNTGYELLEEIITLSSPQGSYLEALRDNVLHPLGIAEKTVPVYENEQAYDNIGVIHIPPGKEAPFGGVSDAFRDYIPLELHPLKQGSLAAGALASNIDDMQRYSRELSKMVAGQESVLTTELDEQQKREIHQGYKDTRGENGYSLGLFINQRDGQCIIAKGGRFPGNKSDMVAGMPFSLDDFLSGQAKDKTGEIETDVYMQKRCFDIDRANDQYKPLLEKFPDVDQKMVEDVLKDLAHDLYDYFQDEGQDHSAEAIQDFKNDFFAQRDEAIKPFFEALLDIDIGDRQEEVSDLSAQPKENAWDGLKDSLDALVENMSMGPEQSDSKDIVPAESKNTQPVIGPATEALAEKDAITAKDGNVR